MRADHAGYEDLSLEREVRKILKTQLQQEVKYDERKTNVPGAVQQE